MVTEIFNNVGGDWRDDVGIVPYNNFSTFTLAVGTGDHRSRYGDWYVWVARWVDNGDGGIVWSSGFIQSTTFI